MKILLICSKAFYGRIEEYKVPLEKLGHEVHMPSSYETPETEALLRGTPEHQVYKAKMFRLSEEKIKNADAVLVLNFNKNGQENYIGGATFIEIYEAFRTNKKIYFVNDIPNNMLKDELIAFNPTIIGDDLTRITDK